MPGEGTGGVRVDDTLCKGSGRSLVINADVFWETEGESRGRRGAGGVNRKSSSRAGLSRCWDNTRGAIGLIVRRGPGERLSRGGGVDLTGIGRAEIRTGETVDGPGARPAGGDLAGRRLVGDEGVTDEAADVAFSLWVGLLTPS